MSYTQYSQYSGNPYQNGPEAEEGNGQNNYTQAPEAQHEMSTYNGDSSSYGAPAQSQNILTQKDFLDRVEFTKELIRQLTSAVQQISTLHQRALSSPDASLTQQLESLVTSTQLKNTQIRDHIKHLEGDASKTQNADRGFKARQAKLLKDQFEGELRSYQQEELSYRQRYRDQIARQYRIVNPDATEDEVREASELDWGSEGVFQTALKTNRTGQASSVLGAVRARHNELQRIEATLTELAAMFADMAQIVEAQEDVIVNTEDNAQKTVEHVDQANVQIQKASDLARKRRTMKWWCFWISILIIIIIVVIVVVVVEVNKSNNK